MVGDRALRVRRRGEVERDGAGEQVVGRARRGRAGSRSRRVAGRVDRLAVGGDRAGRIGGIERIGDQDRGPAGARPLTQRAAAMAARNRPSRVPLRTRTSVAGSSGARQPVAPAEPVGDGAAEALGALVGRIAAEIVEMRGEHRPDEGRDRMLRLADREVDRRLARLHVGQKLAQPHEGRAPGRGGGGGEPAASRQQKKKGGGPPRGTAGRKKKGRRKKDRINKGAEEISFLAGFSQVRDGRRCGGTLAAC